MALKFLVICCLMMLCGVTGCTENVILSPDVVLPQTDQKKVPIKIGYHYVVNETGQQPIILGPLSIKVNDKSVQQGVKAVAQSGFQDAVELPSLGMGTLPHDVPLILVAESANFMVLKKDSGEGRVGFKMKWTIIDRQAKVIWMDTVVSEATDRCISWSCWPSLIERTIPVQFQKARDSIFRYEWWK